MRNDIVPFSIIFAETAGNHIGNIIKKAPIT